MEPQIPMAAEELYRCFVTAPDPRFWPDRLKNVPIQGHGLWSFYQGLCLGMQTTGACPEKL